jgi:GNAT superfamily N-acetyltransferase
MTAVTTYYLEMTSVTDLKAKPDSKGMHVIECETKQFQFNQFLYQFVGKPWHWTDKLAWTDDQWQAYAEADNLRTWVGYHRGAPAGYFELQSHDDNQIKIACFGLAPKFIGQGFGGYLLSQAVKAAWAWSNPQRVWVHTCTLDHPNALKNYQARGFRLYHQETK